MASNLKLEQRAYIKIRTLLGIGPKDILIDFEIVYRDASLSYITVKEWAKRFREGQESIDDDYRSGRPKSAVTSGNTLEIGWMVEEDPHITVDELAMHVGISTGAAHAILIDELNVTKVCSRWIPHSLTKAQKDRRVMCARKLLSEYQDADPRRLSEIIPVMRHGYDIMNHNPRKEKKFGCLRESGLQLTRGQISEIRRSYTQFSLMHMVQLPR